MKTRELLLSAATAYYNGHNIIMSDEDYDNLLSKVLEEDPDFDLFSNIVIGEDRSTVPHPLPYAGYQFKSAFYTIEEIVDVIINMSEHEVITYKWDGCSITAYYNNGMLYDILTRSNDSFGKRKFTQLKDKVPHTVDPKVLKIEFEACCSIEDFGDDNRSNANGLINSCYKQDEVDKFIQLIPFRVTTSDESGYKESFYLAGYDKDDIPVVKEIPTDFSCRNVMYKGKTYPIDGYVIHSSETKHHKIYKHYANQQIVTEITDVEWRFNDNLCWVPRLRYNTIMVDGRRCSTATSKGLNMLRNKQCGVGAKITVFLANSTIPMVDKVIEPSTNYNILTECPFCGHEVVEVCAKLRCSNSECPKLVHVYAWRMFSFFGWNPSEYLVQSLDSLDKIREFKLKHFDKTALISLPYVISKSLVIERFSAHDQIETQLQENINDILAGKSIIDLIKYGLTDNQRQVFDMHGRTIDKIIDILKE